jgi:hypothetical protein
MSRSKRDLDLESLLERGRSIRPVASFVRARSLNRARGTAASRAPALQLLDRTSRRWSRRAIALVAALVAGVASASIAFSARWFAPADEAAPASTAPPHVATPSAAVPPAHPGPTAGSEAALSKPVPSQGSQPPVVASALPSTHAARPAPDASGRSSYTAELELLQRAHASYTSGDFASALSRVAEHSRRFPKGVLAEQREAVRVRSLARAGRNAEAKRAAEAFANRFPRSVLLPQLQRLAGE